MLPMTFVKGWAGALALAFVFHGILALGSGAYGQVPSAPPGEPITVAPAAPMPAQPVEPVTAAPLPIVPTDAVTLEPFVDGLFGSAATAGRIPGAVVVIVRNGQIVLKKGYGFSNLEARNLVDPDKTLFRVASISKVFTALAAMQMVEAGKLDLNADVNTYLSGFKLEQSYPMPVTIAHLMTHAGGFDDRFIGFWSDLGKPVEALGAHLARRMPPRVTAPQLYLNYSNYGYALLGAIVERVAGQDFRAYTQAKIFEPLGMARTGFGAPEPVPADMAQPFLRNPVTGGLKPGQLGQMVPYPAGDLVTTGADMGAFLLSALRYNEGLVSAETGRRMQSDQIVPAGEGTSAWGYGYATGTMNGVRWVGHGGAWPGYAAEFRVSPETQSGFFFAVNTDSQFDLIQPFIVALSDRLWPGPDKGPKIIAVSPAQAAQAKAMQGAYMSHRRVRGDVMLVAAGAGQVSLAADDKGVLTLNGVIPGRPLTLEPIGPGRWFERTYRWTLTHRPAAEGQIEGILLGAFLYERVTLANNFALQSGVLSAAIGVLALAVLLWASGFVARRLFGEPGAVIGTLPKAIGFGGALLALLFAGGLAAGLGNADVVAILKGDLGLLPVLMVLPYLMVPCAAVMVIFGGNGFGSGLRARAAQIWYLITAVALLLTAGFAFLWNIHSLVN